MQGVKFFRQQQVDELKSKVKDNLSWYLREGDRPPCDFDEYGEMKTVLVDATCFDVLNENCTEKHDKENVMAIYGALKDLSLRQAADERIWVYATHVLAKKYVDSRWQNVPKPGKQAIKNIENEYKSNDELRERKIQEVTEKMETKHVLAHYFVSGARGLIRDNAVARLWWMGYAASRCNDYSFDQTLTILLKDSDVRANLLERPSASASEEIFSGIIRVLGNALSQSDSPEIYKRNNFREFMKRINRQGGRIMLNALSPKQLDEMFQRFAEQAIENGATN